MWATTVLLLAALGSQLSIGVRADTVSAAGSTDPPAARFNFSLCKERLCLVNKDAHGKDFTTSDDRTEYKFLLAIWPYSDKKWHIVLQAKIVTPAISLNTLDEAFAEKERLTICTKAGAEMNVYDYDYRLSIKRQRGWHGTDYTYCEFTVETSSNQIMPSDDRQFMYLQMKYGEGRDDYLRIKFLSLAGYLKDYKELCNPDTIKFDEQLKIPGQFLTPIDEFSSSCPDYTKMMYVDDSGKVQQATITCVDIKASDRSKIYRYNIAVSRRSMTGHVFEHILYRDKEFKAFCAQTGGLGFNFAMCEERLCLVNKDPQGKDFTTSEDSTEYKFLLAIWPYSEKKWRVSIQAKIATSSISLNSLNRDLEENGKLLECTKKGEGVEAKPRDTKLSIDKVRGSHGADYFHCEFTLQTSSNQILTEEIRSNYLQMKYGGGSVDYLRIKFGYISSDLEDYKSCNPDTIKFDEQLRIPGQFLTPIDEFSLSCPDNTKMMFVDDSGKVQHATITCVVRTIYYNRKISHYRITPSSGPAIEQPRDKEFKAHCAQTEK